jgi:hypothetical protein
MASDARLWTRRLRWRLAGAWQWPAFAAITVVDAFVVRALPPTGGDLGLPEGLIVSAFGNLLLLGVVAPWLTRRLARRPSRAAVAGAPVPPLEVVQDRVATGLLCAGTLGLLAAGLALRPLVVSETEDTERNGAAVRDYALAHGSDEVVRNLDTANTYRLGEGYFRTCVALDDRRRAWCVFVDTRAEPPAVRPDPNPAPNGAVFRDQRAG